MSNFGKIQKVAETDQEITSSKWTTTTGVGLQTQKIVRSNVVDELILF